MWRSGEDVRAASVWTGDNAAERSHLSASLPMMMSVSIGGISHIGADVGGFFGNPDEQLLARWYQVWFCVLQCTRAGGRLLALLPRARAS